MASTDSSAGTSVAQAANLASALHASNAVSAQARLATAWVNAMTVATNGALVQPISTALQVMVASHAAALAVAVASHAAACAVQTAATAAAASIATASAPAVAAAVLSTAAAAQATADTALLAADLTAANALFAADRTAANALNALISTAFAAVNLPAVHSDTCAALNAAYLSWGSPLTLASWQCSDPCMGVQGVSCNNLGGITSINITSMLWAAASGTRSVPPGFASLTSLQTLVMVNSQLTGSVPTTYSQLVVLANLNIQGNNLIGPLPAQLSSLFALTYLSLSSNKLKGMLAPSLSTLSQISLFDISSNNIHGSLPEQYSTMVSLTRFSVSSNILTGSLPQQWSTLVRLQQSGAEGLVVIDNTGLCGPLKSFKSISTFNTSLTQACPLPPSPPTLSPSPPLPPSVAATLQVSMVVSAASVATPEAIVQLGEGIGQQFATSQDLDPSRVIVSNITVLTTNSRRQLSTDQAHHDAARRELASSMSVLATINMFFDPSVNVTARMATMQANPMAQFDSNFLSSYGITSSTAIAGPSTTPSLSLAPLATASSPGWFVV